MRTLKNCLVAGFVLVFCCVSVASAALVLDENFDGTAMPTGWSFNTAGGKFSTPVVSGGKLTTTMTGTSGYTVGGLGMNIPMVNQGEFDLYYKFKINCKTGSGYMTPTVYMGTDVPTPAEPATGATAGFDWTMYSAAHSTYPNVVTSATSKGDTWPYSPSPPSALWRDVSYGYHVGEDIKNNQNAYVRLNMNTNDHIFTTYVSDNGTDWAETATHAMTAAEQALLESGNYYTNFRLLGYGAITSDIEIDRIWAEADMLGDANRDGLVSAGDYISVQNKFGNSGEIGILGDANLDGVVSAGDFGCVQANYGSVFLATMTPVPEPATLSLLAICGVAMIRRKRN